MPQETHELIFTRLIGAPRPVLWRCWTEPELLKQWFTPRPWTTPVVEIDLRPGGSSRMIFRGPGGEEFPNDGVYLEVVSEKRLVFTDAYRDAWTPSFKPFMTADVTFTEEEGGSRYTARVLHWTAEDKAQHEQMGFHQGWGKAADQLDVLARSLSA